MGGLGVGGPGRVRGGDGAVLRPLRNNWASKESIPAAYSGRRPDPESLVAVFDAMTVDRADNPVAPEVEKDAELAQLLRSGRRCCSRIPGR